MREPEIIESIEDHRVSDYRDVRDADLRGGGGRVPRGEMSNRRCMVESEPVIRRLLHSRHWRSRIRSLLLSSRRLRALADDLTALEHDPPIFTADESMMRDIAGYRHHGGALAAVTRPAAGDLLPQRVFANLRGRARFTLIVAEGVTNVDNIGAILRNAAAFGAEGVLFRSDCADPLFRKAVRVSMGHVFNVPWSVSQDWRNDLLWLRRELEVTPLGAEPGPTARPLPRPSWPDRMAILFGGERHGLSAESIDQCESLISIPMRAGVPSINLATACAVLMYEIRRTQSEEGTS